jgi:SAM-dependent methyltransferase
VRTGPDRDAALAQYRRRAGVYDLELALFESIRRDAVRRLALQPGQTVVDFGCGTGLSLPLLRRAVGARGRVVGVEQSPEMLARARRRVAEQRWRNVELVGAPVELADWSGVGDAALFHFTHDVLQRADAVANAVAHLRPGARVVATGLRWAPRWAIAVNAAVYVAARRSITTLAGLERPWAGLESLLGPMAFELQWFGAVYIAQGVVPAAAGARELRR